MRRRYLQWRYSAGGYLGRLVPPVPHPTPLADPAERRSSVPTPIKQILTDMRGRLWVVTGSAASVSVNGQMTLVNPPHLFWYADHQWSQVVTRDAEDEPAAAAGGERPHHATAAQPPESHNV